MVVLTGCERSEPRVACAVTGRSTLAALAMGSFVARGLSGCERLGLLLGCESAGLPLCGLAMHSSVARSILYTHRCKCVYVLRLCFVRRAARVLCRAFGSILWFGDHFQIRERAELDPYDVVASPRVVMSSGDAYIRGSTCGAGAMCMSLRDT